MKGPTFPAAHLEWPVTERRPNLPYGGLRQPDLFIRPATFSASRAVNLGDGMDGRPSDPERIIMKLHVNRATRRVNI